MRFLGDCGCAERAKTLGELMQGYGGGLDGLGGVEDALWPSTGDINTATDSLAISLSTLGQDIGNDFANAEDPKYQSFLRAWNAFVYDFGQWRRESYFYNPGRRDALVEYRRRFNALLGQYHNFGGAVTDGAARVEGDKRPSTDPFSQAESLISKLVGGAAIVGGIYFAVKFSGFLPTPRRTVVNPRRRARRK